MTVTRTEPSYYHGGAPGLRPGDVIEPTSGTAHLVDGCPTCEARRKGEPLSSDDNDPTLVYVTTDRRYAEVYAAGYPDGALYRVRPIGPLWPRGEHDPVPSFGCGSAQVLSVLDRLVRFDAKRARRALRRYAS